MARSTLKTAIAGIGWAPGGAWLFALLIGWGSGLGNPAVSDPQLVGYDELVAYLSQPMETARGFDSVTAVDPLQITVPFEFDESRLTKLGRRQLDELANALKDPSVAGRRIEIGGHCDERGTERYNLLLSQRRVVSAVRHLADRHQIGEERVLGLGYGKSRPIVAEARTEADHALNRRVEIRLLGPSETVAQGAPEVPSTGRSGAAGTSRAPVVRDALSIDWRVFRTNGGARQPVAYDGTTVLRSGDEYQIWLRPDARSYVYVYQVDSTGDGDWLFPRPESLLKNPLPASGYWAPSRDASFRLSTLSAGERIEETIYLLASARPIPELEQLLKGPGSKTTAETVRELVRGQRVVPTAAGSAIAVPAEGRIQAMGDSGLLRGVIRFGHAGRP